ncbi:hypothetical protein D3C77_674130 [compost metagenome]
MPDDPAAAGAQRTGGQHMFAGPDTARHAPGDPGELRRVEHADGRDQCGQIAADERQHDQRHENLGQGHKDVHHADGGGLRAPAQERHAHADGHAQNARQQHGGARHRQ